MTSPTTATTTSITRGMRLTDYAGVDLTVEGTASGGMGLVVWGPNATSSGQMMALKLLRPDRLAEAAAISAQARAESERQFEEEALVWCHLWAHDSVIAANGLTRLPGLGGMPVLSLEYAPHGSLRRQLQLAKQQRSPLSLRTALAWAIEIAAALAHLHKGDADHERPEPLVHCDLKPENVLLNQRNWALLTDLGLTRAYATLEARTAPMNLDVPGVGVTQLASQTEQQARAAEVARLRAILQQAGQLPPPTIDQATVLATRTLRVPPIQALAPGAASSADSTAGIGAGIGSRGPVAGSLPYMAPEQWLGLDATTPATDLYAFGVLLFELFVGYAAPFPYPRDPIPYLTPALYTHALLTNTDPLALAWHATHTRQPLPATTGTEARGQAKALHQLTDPAMQAAALASGPCAELVARGERERAAAALRQVSALVEACLVTNPTARPNAAQIVERLETLVADPCGLEPVQVPQPLPHSPQTERAFWSNLGVTYSGLGREREAIAAKRKALTHDPSHPVNWLNLGSSLGALGEQERRQARAGAMQGQMAEAAQLAAQARGHWEEALDAFQQAERRLTDEILQEWPGLPAEVVANEANTLGSLERYGEAVTAYERSLALDPEKHVTRFNLTVDLARWSQVAGATEVERVARLERAQRELDKVLIAAPEYRQGRELAARIAQALVDPAHRFQG